MILHICQQPSTDMYCTINVKSEMLVISLKQVQNITILWSFILIILKHVNYSCNQKFD